MRIDIKGIRPDFTANPDMAADYHSLLRRAVSALDSDSRDMRRRLYDRARQKLVAALGDADVSLDDLNAERSALEAAIARIEAEIPYRDEARPARRDARAQTRTAPASRTREPVARTSPPGQRPPPAPERRRHSSPGAALTSATVSSIGIGVAVGAVVLAFAAVIYVWLTRSPGTADKSTPGLAPPAVAERPAAASGAPAKAPDAEIEETSARARLSYVYRRQPVFYRTAEAAGTVIIDKPQHFLYLVQPNNVAVRYGIGVGDACLDLSGLLRVSNKVEWPAWRPSDEIVKQDRRAPKAMPGGIDNPLGARALYMGDEVHSIHGTNAPRTIGGTAPVGCVGLANDQVIDLYGRVPVGTKVVARN